MEAFSDPKVKGVTLYLSDFSRPMADKLVKGDFFSGAFSSKHFSFFFYLPWKARVTHLIQSSLCNPVINICPSKEPHIFGGGGYSCGVGCLGSL